MAGVTGNCIQGGPYAPKRTEAADVLQKPNVVGTFGAKGKENWGERILCLPHVIYELVSCL